jgi:hypothetical protein
VISFTSSLVLDNQGYTDAPPRLTSGETPKAMVASIQREQVSWGPGRRGRAGTAQGAESVRVFANIVSET